MPATCYPALRRLPGRDLHPLEKRSKARRSLGGDRRCRHGAPWRDCIARTGSACGRQLDGTGRRDGGGLGYTVSVADLDKPELVPAPPAELRNEPPVVARLVVEIRSDGTRTIAGRPSDSPSTSGFTLVRRK